MLYAMLQHRDMTWSLRASCSDYLICAYFIFSEKIFVSGIQFFTCALRKTLFPKHIFYQKIVLGIIVKIIFIKHIKSLKDMVLVLMQAGWFSTGQRFWSPFKSAINKKKQDLMKASVQAWYCV
jgi:hypothetical protein